MTGDQMNDEWVVALYGTAQPVPVRRKLNAGPLQATWEAGGLRNICFDGVEVVRGIDFLSRNEKWGNVQKEITQVYINEQEERFRVSFNLALANGQDRLAGSAEIEGQSSGQLTFSVSLSAETDFATNRTGFTILHPLKHVVGRSVEVTHTDGSQSRQTFPERISPGQPIFNIRSLMHDLEPGPRVSIHLSGAKFEMEDHRNWMDASYKTYSGSLLDPWPYVIPKSDLVEQTIKLEISRKIAATARCPNCTENSVKLGDTAGVLPSLGTALPLEPSKYPSNLADYLDCLGAAYCVGRFDCRLADHKQQTAVLTSFAQNSDIPLRLELVLSETKSAETELREVANTLGYHGISPSAVIVTKASDMKSFQPGDPRPSGPSYAEMANAARKTFPNAQIGGGMVAFFTELNRLPVQHGLFDFVTHAVCPAVHAADDQSLMENLESAKWIFASARAMIGKTQYHLGPSWISTRVNPYGLGVFSNHLNERNCLADHDPRQCGLFGAAWALGLLASSANAGLDAVALASLTGPQGLAIGPDDRTPPGHPTAKVTPAFHVLRGLAAHGSCRVLATTVAEPESIAALGLASSVGPELWLANLTNTAQDIRIDGWQGQPSMLAMDHTNYEDAIQPKFLDLPRTKLNSVTSLRLAPYAIVRLSSGID